MTSSVVSPSFVMAARNRPSYSYPAFSSTRTDAVIPNGGFLEVRSDAGNTFAGVNVTPNNASTFLLVDRGTAGTGSLNQTISLGNIFVNNNLNAAIVSGRDGTNLSIPLLTLSGTANSTILTANSEGTR